MSTKIKHFMESISNILFLILVLLGHSFFCEGGQSDQKNLFATHAEKSPVKTIQHASGDIVDCVNIYDQPAFHHPLLRNHKIKMKPSFYPTGVMSKTNHSAEVEHLHGQGESEICPDGTIPILRSKTNDKVPNFRSLPIFMNHSSWTPNSRRSLQDRGFYRQVAMAVARNGPYYGCRAILNVWNPSVEDVGEETDVHIGLISGSSYLAAGWTVDNNTFIDKQTRLYFYWTADNFQHTGCTNLQCPGFIQTSKVITLGSMLLPVSTYGGQQYEVTFTIWKNDYDKNWYFQYNNIVVGYMPYSVVPEISNSAQVAFFGGSARVSKDDPKGHSATQMGSGHFPSEGYGKSCYVADVSVLADINHFTDPGKLDTSTTAGLCYDISDLGNKGGPFNRLLMVGGPGYNSMCPHHRQI